MTDLPAPLTPPECDLRDYLWMPLDVRRLLNSETWILGTPEVKVACMTLWCEAWQQVPAGSLPDNQGMLAHLSGAGAAWKRIGPEVLKGWQKCADGRLYHPVVAEKAKESWERKLAQKAKTEAARLALAEKRKGKRVGTTEAPPTPAQPQATVSVTEAVRPTVTDTDTASTIPDQTIPPSLRSGDTEAAPRTPAASCDPIDARTLLWREGVPIIRRLTGKPDSACRTLMGRWLGTLRDDCPAMLRVLQDAAGTEPADPVAWITAACAAHGRPVARAASRPSNLDWMAEELGIGSFSHPGGNA